MNDQTKIASWRPASGALPSLTPSSPEAEAENARKVRRAYLLATRMYACYRREDAADAATMLDAAAVVLANYPDEVMETVTHPVTGIPGRLKWPPNIAEIREACEIALAPIKARREREAAAERVRREREAADRIEAERPARPGYDDLKAHYGPNWGINPPPEAMRPAMKHYHATRPLSPEERQAMYSARAANGSIHQGE